VLVRIMSYMGFRSTVRSLSEEEDGGSLIESRICPAACRMEI
jgi:hypothetical protein